MLYAFLIAVVGTDTRNKVTSLGNTLLNYVVQEPDPTDATTTLYWLGFGGTKIQGGTNPKDGTPTYIQINGYIGFSDDVTNSVKGVLDVIQPFCREIERPAGEPATAIESDLRQAAGYDGCDHGWAMTAADNATVASAATLLAKFTPIS